MNLLDGSFLTTIVSQLQLYYVDVMSCFDNEVDSTSRKHVLYFHLQTDGVSASCRMVKAGSTHS